MEIYGIQVSAETVPVDDDGDLLDLLATEVVALRVTIAQLQQDNETITAEREEWKARALAAESGNPADGKFNSLRRLLAHELHPDHCQEEAERRVRAEIFKRLWPEIERIAEGK